MHIRVEWQSIKFDVDFKKKRNIRTKCAFLHLLQFYIYCDECLPNQSTSNSLFTIDLMEKIVCLNSTPYKMRRYREKNAVTTTTIDGYCARENG